MTNWLRGKGLDIHQFHSKNIKLANFTGLSFIYLPLLKLLTMSLLLCTIKAHLGLLSEYIQNDLLCKKFCWISVTLRIPRKIKYFVLLAVWFLCSCVRFRHTWVFCKIFFILSSYKMHCNDLKCGEIVDDFCYIPKSFCSIKTDFFLGGGGCGLIFCL